MKRGITREEGKVVKVMQQEKKETMRRPAMKRLSLFFFHPSPLSFKLESPTLFQSVFAWGNVKSEKLGASPPPSSGHQYNDSQSRKLWPATDTLFRDHETRKKESNLYHCNRYSLLLMTEWSVCSNVSLLLLSGNILSAILCPPYLQSIHSSLPSFLPSLLYLFSPATSLLLTTFLPNPSNFTSLSN